MLEKVKSKLNIVTFFIVFSAIWLTIMSFAVPISQTPDEFTHFINMMDLYGTPVYIHETTGTLYDDAELTTFNAEGVHPVNAEAYKKAGMQRYEHKLKITDFKPSVSAVKFLPAAIGFYLGVLLRLPKLVCLQMAELFSALFFIVLGAIALKKAPFKKEVFLFTMLMPMTIQQCSSFNPDVIVIACSVLLTAWILDMKFREGDVTWKDIIVLGLLSFEILIAKQIYVLLAASIIIVPFSKYKLPIGKKFDLAVPRMDLFHALCASEEGFIQLSSHVGNYELVGYSLVSPRRINALVYSGETATVMQNRALLFGETNVRMVPVSEDLSHIFMLNNALADGEIASLPGDRVFGSQKTVSCRFFGEPA